MPTVYAPPPRLKVLPPLTWTQPHPEAEIWIAETDRIALRIRREPEAAGRKRPYRTEYRFRRSPGWLPSNSWSSWADATAWLQTAAAKFAQAEPIEG